MNVLKDFEDFENCYFFLLVIEEPNNLNIISKQNCALKLKKTGVMEKILAAFLLKLNPCLPIQIKPLPKIVHCAEK